MSTRKRRKTWPPESSTGDMSTLYNDNNLYCAAWLRNLVRAGHLPPGRVDSRDIVTAAKSISYTLPHFTQAHFFAGIGGWPCALRMAGWPDDEPVWTASLPCQPLSEAGHKRGAADHRHLWPIFGELVAKHKPPILLGEQVANPLGREWMAAVRVDLEDLGYAVGIANLPAASVGAPHYRSRLWWCALGDSPKQSGIGDTPVHASREPARENRRPGAQLRDVGDADGERLEGQRAATPAHRREPEESPSTILKAGLPLRYPWHELVWTECADGKWRCSQPGLQPLAHGVPRRVDQLRACGNAIVVPLAAAFITAVMQHRQEQTERSRDGEG